MPRKLMIAVTLFALSMGFAASDFWRASSRNLPPAPAQATRYEFVEHVIDDVRPCESNPLSATRNSAQAAYDFNFNSDTLAPGCTNATIPDGKITLDFPATFTEGVSFTPSINVNGTFQLRVDAQHFSVRGYGLTVDTVIDRLPKREDPGVHQDLRNAPCPLTRFRKNPPLNGGTSAAPGLNPFANNASCSIKAPDLFQSYEGNLLLIISTIDVVVGGDPIGPVNYFNYTGIRLMRFTVTSKYRPAATCPAPGLQNGQAGTEQNCPPARLKVETQAEVFAGDSSFVKVTALKADGAPDTGYNGMVQVSLEQGSTPKIGCLFQSTNSSCVTALGVALEGGTLKHPLFLQTPEQQLTASTVLKAGDPVLTGTALIRAESEGIAATSEVMVKSPLDLKIDRIEVQQGVKPEFESDSGNPWVQYRDLLIRVFIDANTQEFNKYLSIRDITAQLTVRNQTGAEIEGSPFTISLGAFAKGTDSPNEPYVFQIAPDALGGDSLNHLLYVTQEQLSLTVKLNEVYPDKNTTDNEKTLPPLSFVASKPMTVLYSPARLKTDKQTTNCPTEAGIAKEINLVQLAYPVSFPETAGQLRFIQAPNPSINESCEALTSDPLPLRPITRWWFWLNRTKRSDVKAWVYFVDKDFFPAINKPSHAGISSAIGGSIAIVSDKCLGPDTGSQCGVLAHELGHLFSLGDTYSSTAVTPIRSPNNFPQGNLNGNHVGLGSYSWFHHRFSISSTDFYDFMGSSYFSWTDWVTWRHLRSQLLPVSNSNAQVRSDTPAAAPAVGDNFVVVQGRISKNGAVELASCYTLTGEGLADASSSGGYIIETLDGNATVLNSFSFTPSFRLPDSTIDLEAADFSFALPFSSAVRQVRIRSAEGALAARQVSAASPVIGFSIDFGGQTLTGVKTVQWNGSDADGNALSYSLFYSPDGQLQIPLELETTNTGYEWNTDEVPAGASPRLTLTATDGVNAVTIESSTFTIPNRAPKVVILAPANQQQFKTGETVNFEASIYDIEEGQAWRPVLTWSSNLQGSLGTGRQLAVNNLLAGTHLITAAGDDSQGARGSASITVNVSAGNFSNLEAAPGSVDFGSIAVGQMRDFRLSVQNTGNAPFTVNAMTSSNPQFSTLAPAVPFTIAPRSQQEVSVRFTPVTAGGQSGTLTIAANASNRSSLGVALTGNASGATARSVATVSAASYSGQTLADESIVAAFGANLATSIVVNNTLPLPTSLAGTTVNVRDSMGADRLAPLFFVAPQQINYLIPPGTAPGIATIAITGEDGSLSVGNITIAAIAPGLFAANANGQGVAAAVALRVKADGSQSYEPVSRYDQAQNSFVAAPIEPGPDGEQVYLLLFGTGLRFNSGLQGVTCKIGGIDAPVLYAGAQGDLVGLDQVNLSLPRALAGRGEVDLVLTVDGQAANTVRVAFAGNQTCNYAISPTSLSFNANANTGSVNVQANNGCAWTAASNAGFIAITGGANGAGNGTVNFTVDANLTTNQRTGTLTIAGQTFTVTQAAAAPLTVNERRITGGPIPDQCAPPTARTAFLTTDERVYQWTLVSGARVGDQVRWEFSPVNGSFVQTQQYTVAFNDNVCFWASLNIAGSPAASFPGNWQVSLFYNNALLFTDNFTISTSGIRVTESRVTGGPIPDQCLPPAAKKNFAPTDGQAYLWVLVAGAKIGDLARFEFVQPNGVIYNSSEYTMTFNDNVCFWGGINIAGTQAALLPGNWQVRLLYNGALLMTENFTIAAAGAGFKQGQQ
ncbi:MAG: choice-of-anchor D domain-containing protein [Acidobacteria bacterium]|nr:choice-of-anchor D domain-containing protein [Acidobacteriota bacterium]